VLEIEEKAESEIRHLAGGECRQGLDRGVLVGEQAVLDRHARIALERADDLLELVVLLLVVALVPPDHEVGGDGALADRAREKGAGHEADSPGLHWFSTPRSFWTSSRLVYRPSSRKPELNSMGKSRRLSKR
jgi:hypothetical protein